MIEFMLIGAPRSGTTWASNWLTTDTTLCMHGLSAKMHHTEWDSIKSNKMLGVSDPAISKFHRWLNQHPARKVIVHRDSKEVCESVGIHYVPNEYWELNKVDGMHVNWLDLFNNPKPIYEFLLQREFDQERHDMLKTFQINTMAKKVKLDKSIVHRMIKELQEENELS